MGCDFLEFVAWDLVRTAAEATVSRPLLFAWWCSVLGTKAVTKVVEAAYALGFVWKYINDRSVTTSRGANSKTHRQFCVDAGYQDTHCLLF